MTTEQTLQIARLKAHLERIQIEVEGLEKGLIESEKTETVKDSLRWRAKPGGKYYYCSSQGYVTYGYDGYDGYDENRSIDD